MSVQPAGNGEWRLTGPCFSTDSAVHDLGAHAPMNALTIHKVRRRRHEPGRPVAFAGPWIGEFGWELARWQGGVRKLAAGSDRHVIVMGDPGHDVLYPYADEYWETPAFFRAQGFTRQCDHVRGGHHVALHLALLGHLTAHELRDEELAPYETVSVHRFRPDEQDHVRLGRDEEPDDTFICMPRTRAWQSSKNWPGEDWVRLCEALRKATRLRPLLLNESYWLRDSIQALRRARFAVCQEGGGSHLAALCGTPAVVFGRERWRGRATEEENFLGTPVRYVGRPDDNHTPEEVADACLDFVRTL